MLTSFDDYPVHQTSQPIAITASSDVNHYDRYFFSGYTADARLYFASAMGLYPNRHVVDAAFSVVVDGGTQDARQINVYASERAPTDRFDATTVGPIRVTVVEPLRVLRIDVDAPAHGIRAELTFTHRSEPIQEPHFFHRVGQRVLIDYTRLTQFGRWAGWIEIDGERVDLDPVSTCGARDRSWGVRPVGERGPTGAPVADPQFFWLWAPVSFEPIGGGSEINGSGVCTHFDVNELSDGRRWHETGFVALDGVHAEAMRHVDYRLSWRPGTRSYERFELELVPWEGEPTTLTFEPLYDFHMAGLGYTHPEWAHGCWKGESVVGGDRWDLPVDDPVAPDRVHVQTISRVTATGGIGGRVGLGVLEQLAIGRHTPTALEGFYTGAPG